MNLYSNNNIKNNSLPKAIKNNSFKSNRINVNNDKNEKSPKIINIIN
jgi:hypothetical protein